MNEKIFKRTETPIKGGILLPLLIEIRGHQCECCKEKYWNNQKITLQVHHKDGDRKNNELENLQLLCPNCHSQTDNFGSKNIKNNSISEEKFVEALKNNISIRQALFSLGLSDASGNYKRARKLIEKYDIQNLKPKEDIYCIKCGKKISKGSTYCIDCYRLEQRMVKNRPERADLKNMIRTMPFTQIGRIYNVSDNAVRKWCLADRLPTTKKDINAYSNEEWELI